MQAELISRQSDPQLMQLVQRQNKHALATLYERYTGRALGLAVKILRNRALAEDVAQEAFWRVWQRAAQFEWERGDFARWLDGIVRHLAIDELRRHRMIARNENDDHPEDSFADDVVDQALDVVEVVDERLRSEQVRAALQQLPTLQRQVLELSFFHGLTRQEISQRLGEPLGTIHTRAWLGLHKLRQLVGSEM